MEEKIQYLEGSSVTLMNGMGSDKAIARAARVSTLGDEAVDFDGKDKGLIRYLMRKRHGSPFEHNAMTFLVTAPLFVFYEWHRHRVGFSYNEESGRYRELEPVFYSPPDARPLVQVGKASEYRLEPGEEHQRVAVRQAHETAAWHAWQLYQMMLNDGIAKEVARNVLPVSLMKTMYVTCNVRSLMHLLSLRTDHPDARFPSSPLWEFAKVADDLEAYGARLFPLTFEAFNEFGRVAP